MLKAQVKWSGDFEKDYEECWCDRRTCTYTQWRKGAWWLIDWLFVVSTYGGAIW
jgi:hypothetical protein